MRHQLGGKVPWTGGKGAMGDVQGDIVGLCGGMHPQEVHEIDQTTGQVYGSKHQSRTKSGNGIRVSAHEGERAMRNIRP